MGFFQDVGNAVSNVFKGGGGGKNKGGGNNNSQNDAIARQQAEQLAAMQRLIAAQQAAAAAAAAAEAERIRQENIRRENEKAQSAMNKSFDSARGMLGQQNTMQSNVDATALARQSGANLAAGAGATGAGASPNLKQSTYAQTIGVAPSTSVLPTPSNVNAAVLAGSTNQMTGNTPNQTNKFSLPNVTGLTFGGA